LGGEILCVLACAIDVGIGSSPSRGEDKGQNVIGASVFLSSNLRTASIVVAK
ncbi:hypothetical protein ACLOJK_027915, partial [Asimina triloba]